MILSRNLVLFRYNFLHFSRGKMIKPVARWICKTARLSVDQPFSAGNNRLLDYDSFLWRLFLTRTLSTRKAVYMNRMRYYYY